MCDAATAPRREKQIFKWNSFNGKIFRVGFDVLLVSTEFQTETLVIKCYEIS